MVYICMSLRDGIQYLQKTARRYEDLIGNANAVVRTRTSIWLRARCVLSQG